MAVLQNIIGQQFSRLTVIAFAGRRKRRAYWRCRCTCRRTVVVLGENLKSGRTKSCSCLKEERLEESHQNAFVTPEKRRAHACWARAKSRVLNPNDSSWHRYGARGITMCKQWIKSFKRFYADMGPCPEGMSLDRINNNGNYEPGNCRYATPTMQARNRRTTIFVDYENERIPLTEAAERSGIQYQTLLQRYRGIKSKQPLFGPVQNGRHGLRR